MTKIKFIKQAFTLAEVLIVLGVIGIIAEMTIPTVLQNVQTSVTISSLKKVYSTISQAYDLAVTDNGTPDNWNLIGYQDPQGAINMYNILAPNLRVIKNCGTGTGCFSNNYYNLNGTASTSQETLNNRTKFQLVDGSTIAILVKSETCSLSAGTSLALQNICASIIVDINGLKAPNTTGKDTFLFEITKYGVVPRGTSFATSGDISESFEAGCQNKTTQAGSSCAAWVIYNENMDYLKDNCTNLSWSGPTKCN